MGHLICYSMLFVVAMAKISIESISVMAEKVNSPMGAVKNEWAIAALLVTLFLPFRGRQAQAPQRTQLQVQRLEVGERAEQAGKRRERRREVIGGDRGLLFWRR